MIQMAFGPNKKFAWRVNIYRQITNSMCAIPFAGTPYILSGPEITLPAEVVQ